MRNLPEQCRDATRQIQSMASSERRRPFADLKPPSERVTFTRSTFGNQALSQRTTEPRTHFGSADREKMDNLYYSAEHSKTRLGNYGPGPAYELRSSLGKQVTSINESAPEPVFLSSKRFIKKQFGEGTPGPGTYTSPSSFGEQVISYLKSPGKADFGRSTRDQQSKVYLSPKFDKSKYGVESPGPAVCDDRSSLGNQVTSVKKTMPQPRFGVERRFKYGQVSSHSTMPGVGQYKSIGAVGKQPDSLKATKPAYSFSVCDRDRREKVYLSPAHDKVHYGESSPGPAANIRPHSSLGHQIDSRKLSYNAVRFGSAPRFKGYRCDSPGPGEYNC